VTAAGAHFGQPGYETDLLSLASLAALSGPFALDRLRRGSRQGLAALQQIGYLRTADVIAEAQSSLREMSIADGLHIKGEDVGSLAGLIFLRIRSSVRPPRIEVL
jgi:hypothetical protein